MRPPNGKADKRVVVALPFRREACARVAATMPQSIDIGDLVQDGVTDSSTLHTGSTRARGIKFETFARARIRGAMIDALRKDAWPRGCGRPSAARARSGRASSCGASSDANRRWPTGRERRLRRETPWTPRCPHQTPLNHVAARLADHVNDSRCPNHWSLPNRSVRITSPSARKRGARVRAAIASLPRANRK